MLKCNYYISSFFWSTVAKILNAILGFVSVPLLLELYGKADYGVLSIATACNAYMNLLDLGMNVGAVKYFSQWRAEGKYMLLSNVVHTNITFYIIISAINILGLVILGVFGEPLFSISHEQFLQLRICLFILALFSVFSWTTTVFNQLLIADRQMAYTMKMQCVQVLLKILLVFAVVWTQMSLSVYFFFLTLIIALLIVPYTIRSLKCKLIDNLSLGFFWRDFKIVLFFSLSLFALSLFQVTSTQSRPLILSMFAADGASAVADFRIMELFPQFIIVIGGAFTSILLPKTSEMVVRNDRSEIEMFAYNSTLLTSILTNILCCPLILGGNEILTAFVGDNFYYLYPWMVVWIICVLFQVHSTPSNALILAYGKVRGLVIVSAVACIISMIINATLAKQFDVGSAIIGYFVYIIIVLSSYYMFFYKRILGLKRKKIFFSFLLPTICGFIAIAVVLFLNIDSLEIHIDNKRIVKLVICLFKALSWLIVFVVLLFTFRIIRYKNKMFVTCFKNNLT